MPNFFVDIRQDLVYAYGWPSQLVRPIWKVKQAPKRAYPSFQRFLCPIAHHFLGDPNSDVKNAKFFRGRPSRPCLCIRLAITACPTHLEAYHFLGDPDFDVKNAKFFRGRPSRPCLYIRKVKRVPKRAYPSFRRFSCAIAHHFLGDPDSDVKNIKKFCGRPSRPCLCIRFAITPCPTHLEGQTSPEARIPLISTIFAVKNAKFFRRRPSRPFLYIRLAITSCPTQKVKRSPKRAYPSFRQFSCAIAHHFLGNLISTSKMQKIFMGVRQDLVYAYGWPSRLVRPIWKVKRVPKRAYPSFRRFSCAIAHHFLDLVYAYGWTSRLLRPIWKVKRAPKRAYPSFYFLGDPDSDVKNAKFFRGRPPRPYLCIRLAITACSTHLEAHHFLGDPDSDVKNAKFFRRRLSRPCLCIRLVITACPTHLEGQTSPEASIPLILTIFVPCLCIRLAITTCPTHLESQMSPEASIPLISMIFVCYSTPFFG
uniref:Uncharacterized protein n=1 Tax=Solanum lycopersicum TaxID=4081 RepID=A0A3Q7GCA1_SOLLC